MAISTSPIEDIALKYKTDDIFILGKGPSADDVDAELLKNGVTITLNDAEKIAPGDIGIFHASWVLESLGSVGLNCDLYVTNQPLPEPAKALPAEYLEPDQFNTDLIVKRFFEEELVIEDVMLITAIKVARIIADLRMRRQNVYLIGFDFNVDRGYSKRLGGDYSGDDRSYQAGVISAQEHYLLVFLHLLRKSNLHLVHVGDKSYSEINTKNFVSRLGGRESVKAQTGVSAASSRLVRSKAAKGDTESRDHVLITAEITTNHFGDLERLERMVRRAHDAGADYVKVQKRNVDTFYTETQLQSPFDSPFGKTFGDYRRQLELDEAGFRFLGELTRELGIGWFASVLDRPSFDFVNQFEPSLIKLPSTISEHVDLLEHVATTYKGGVVLSTGLTDQTYENFVLDAFKNTPCLYLLQCTSAYPTPPQDCNVGVVRHYRDLSRTHANIIPGYSSHDYGSTACELAVAAGARMVEKHVKYGDAEWAHFDNVALDLSTDAFHEFVKRIRLAELIIGAESKSISGSEHHKYWLTPAKENAK